MRIGEVLRRWRRVSDIGLREAARDIGVSHGTLSRVERGEEMSGDTLAKVLAWLFKDGTRSPNGVKEK